MLHIPLPVLEFATFLRLVVPQLQEPAQGFKFEMHPLDRVVTQDPDEVLAGNSAG